MTDLITALFKEAEKQPLATFLLILLAISAAIYFLAFYPKHRQEKMKAQMSLAANVASSNECIRNSSVVINALGECVKNNTQALELTRQTMGNVCTQLGQLQDRMEDHDVTARKILEKVTENNAILRN